MGDVRRANQAKQDADIVEMRTAGLSFRNIAQTLDISEQTAEAAFKRGVAAVPREAAEEHRMLSRGRQEFVVRKMVEVMSTFHPLVNNGHIIFHPDTGEMFNDPAWIIAAAKILVDVDKRYASLLGLDAPRTSIKIEMGAIEAEIRNLEAQLGEDLPRGDGGMRDNGRERKAIEGPPGFR
jgi:hypothetical protein